VNAALAPSSPWYCVTLRRASAWLEAAARRLEVTALDTAAPAPADGERAVDAWRRVEREEERLREVRLRSLRYY
jgi:hypothetical protein